MIKKDNHTPLKYHRECSYIFIKNSIQIGVKKEKEFINGISFNSKTILGIVCAEVGDAKNIINY